MKAEHLKLFIGHFLENDDIFDEKFSLALILMKIFLDTFQKILKKREKQISIFLGIFFFLELSKTHFDLIARKNGGNFFPATLNPSVHGGLCPELCPTHPL